MDAGETRGTASAEPNVIPLIDILLVLLIIFMVNVGSRQAIELQLPQEATAPQLSEAQIVLEVRPDGRFVINQQDVPAGELRERLQGIYAGRPEKILFVKGDPRVRYQDVIAAIDVARGAGVEVIGVAPKDVGKGSR